MSTGIDNKLFQRNSIFKNLNENELAEIIGISKRQNYADNEAVFSQNQEAEYLFLVENGKFKLTLPNANSKSLFPGELFGEIGIINRNLRTGTVRSKGDSSAYLICGKGLFDGEKVSPNTSLKVIRALAVKITNYLRSRELTATKDLINEGETEHIEFKSSLRWNIHINKKDKAIEHASLKTIAAFLNSEGGTLLVGVNDEQEILGLKEDQFANADKVLLHLNKLIKDKIGTLHTQFINSEVEEIDGKNVLRVDCEAGTIPAYLKNGNEEIFYIRTGPATTNLTLSKVHDYIMMRFK